LGFVWPRLTLPGVPYSSLNFLSDAGRILLVVAGFFLTCLKGPVVGDSLGIPVFRSVWCVDLGFG